jgi:hypothetical protein
MKDRATILNEAKERMNNLGFGEPVTNICAGDESPNKHGFFVEFVTKTYKNKWGVSHNDYWAKITDRKGKFWNAGIEVIYPGTLTSDECLSLWKPIHRVLYDWAYKETEAK